MVSGYVPVSKQVHGDVKLFEHVDQLAAMLPAGVDPTGPKPLRQWLTHLF